MSVRGITRMRNHWGDNWPSASSQQPVVPGDGVSEAMAYRQGDIL
jgi:hypothetical protein